MPSDTAYLAGVMRTAKNGARTLAFVDAVTLIFLLIVLYLCPPTRVIDFTAPDAALELLHIPHLVMILFVLIVVAADALFLPVWFALFALVMLAFDVYVLVARVLVIAATPLASLDFVCLVMLGVLDGFLLALTGGYLLYGINTLATFAAAGGWDGAVLGTLWPRRKYLVASTAGNEPDEADDKTDDDVDYTPVTVDLSEASARNAVQARATAAAVARAATKRRHVKTGDVLRIGDE